MIDGMLISSFKGFPAPWNYLPIRPITLIFGANAAGKSSLLQAIALANHIHHGGKPDTEFMKLTGNRINLGGFKKFITRTDIYGGCSPLELVGEVIGIGFGFRLPNPVHSSDGSSWLMSEGQKTPPPGWYALFEIGPAGVESFNILAGAIPMQWTRENDRFKFQDFEISGGLSINNMNTQEENKKFIIKPELIQNYLLGIDSNFDFSNYSEEQYINFGIDLKKSLMSHSLLFNGLSPQLRENGQHVVGNSDEVDEFISNLKAAVIQMGEEINEFLSTLGYIGPWRQIPNLDDLISAREGLTSTELSLWDQVREDEGVRRELNQWIGRFNSNLEFATRDMLDREDVLRCLELVRDQDCAPPEESGPPHFATTEKREEAEEQSEERSTLSKAIEAVGSLPPSVRALILRLAPSNIEISPGNTGVGISQLVPVLVAAISREPKNWLIEQPELHLHPKAQALLGDLFIRGARAGRSTGQRFVIETHSEHLILRILRRIRETNQLFEKNEFPVHPEEVAVAYVGRKEHSWLQEAMNHLSKEQEFQHLDLDDETDRATLRKAALDRQDGFGDQLDFLQVSESRIVSIPISPGGDFEIDWPGGFFEERLDELLSADEVKLWRTKQSGPS